MNRTLENVAKSILIENSTYDNLNTDIGRLIYVKDEYKTKGGQTILDKRFCDNFIMINIFDASQTVNTKNPKGGFKNGQSMIKKEYCAKLNADFKSVFNGELGYNLGKLSCKAPRVFEDFFLYNLRNEEASDIIDYIDSASIKDPVYTFLKVDASSYNFWRVISDLEDKKEELAKLGFFLHDYDLTEDLTGVFNKGEVIEYLTSKGNFHLESKNPAHFSEHVILNKDSTSGLNCLVMIHGNLKIKMYNKFVAQVTSVGTDKSIGNQIFNYIDPNTKDKNSYLRTLFTNEKFVESGCTRLEITYYVLNTQLTFGSEKIKNYSLRDKPYYNVFDYDDLISSFEKYKSLMREDGFPLYETPVSSMWETLTSSLRNNCCLYFPKEKKAFVSLWVNKLTGKVIGYDINLDLSVETDILLRQIKSNYSLNGLPFFFITIEDSEHPENYKLETYMKYGPTYITKYKYLFSSSKVDLINRGIVPTNTMTPKLFTEEQNARYTKNLSKVILIETKDKQMFFGNVNNKTKERNYHIEQELSSIQTTDERKEYEMMIQKKYENGAKTSEQVSFLRRAYDILFTADIEVKFSYHIKSFSVSTRLKYPKFFLLLSGADNKIIDKKFEAKAELKTKLLSLDKSKLSKISKSDHDIYYILDEHAEFNTILQFVKKGVMNNPHYKAPFDIFDFTLVEEDNIENNTGLKLQDVLDKNLITTYKHLTPLDDGLKDNSEYKVVKYNTFYFRDILKFSIVLENDDRIYRSNTYFEQEMYKHKDLIDIAFSFRTVEPKVFKTGKHKKEMVLKFLL